MVGNVKAEVMKGRRVVGARARGASARASDYRGIVYEMTRKGSVMADGGASC